MNDVVPVLEATDWDELIAAIAGHSAACRLNSASPGVARAVLAAPAAIAYWIAQSGSTLPQPLRLLVIGAEKLDAVDEGRWYQLIPLLLGCSTPIEVTLIGDRLNRRFDSPLYGAAPAVAANMHVGRLSGYFESEGDPSADLAVLFHPGFQKHRGWLQDGSLRRLHALGIPVVTVSYEADESELERWVVGCHGFDAVTAPLLNPFFVDFSDGRSQIHWGRAMWRFWPRSAATDASIDQPGLDALDRLGDMVLHSIDLGKPMRAAFGQKVALQFARSDTRSFIYVFDDFLVDPSDGSLYRFDADRLARIGALSQSELASYPGEDAPELARAVWAADIKARSLLGLYPRRIEPTELRQRARAMHADLEDKVERLFRP